MPKYVPDLDNPVPADELIEQLGAQLASQYAGAEDALIESIARKSYADIRLQDLVRQAGITAERTKELQDSIRFNRASAELDAFRAVAIRELQFLAVEVTEKLRREGLAEKMIHIAASEGEAQAAAAMRMAKRLPLTSTFTGTASQAVTALTIDLQSRLEAMNMRITRFPQDAYQRVISMTAPLITAPLAESFGRAPVMSLASISFLAAAFIWFRMPETVGRKIII